MQRGFSEGTQAREKQMRPNVAAGEEGGGTANIVSGERHAVRSVFGSLQPLFYYVRSESVFVFHRSLLG